jgi:hypothetical protein
MRASKAANWIRRNGPPWPSKAEVRKALETEGTIREAARKLQITGYRLYAILDGETTTGRHHSKEHRRRISEGVRKTEAERRARGETRQPLPTR